MVLSLLMWLWIFTAAASGDPELHPSPSHSARLRSAPLSGSAKGKPSIIYPLNENFKLMFHHLLHLTLQEPPPHAAVVGKQLQSSQPRVLHPTVRTHCVWSRRSVSWLLAELEQQQQLWLDNRVVVKLTDHRSDCVMKGHRTQTACFLSRLNMKASVNE